MAKILITDDAEFLRRRISKLLLSEGHTIIEAGDGCQAISLYQTLRPDLVLMDITMPELDGLSALKQIRAYDPRARVIMLTALGQDAVVTEAIRRGAVDFVVKPFDPQRVLSTIAAHLPLGVSVSSLC